MDGSNESEERPILGLLDARKGVLQELWQSKAWRIFPLFLLYTTGLTLMAPITPTLMTNFFASQSLGTHVHCEAYNTTSMPPACQNAHSTVVLWSSWTGFISNSLLSFVMMPLIGDWSDVHGRRPFITIALLVSSLTTVVIILHVNLGTSLLWMYPATAIQGCTSSISVSLAFLADLMSPANRAAAFGMLMASFGLGVLIGPSLGLIILSNVYDGLHVAAWAALASCMACVAYSAVWLPESLRPSYKRKARERLRNSTSVLSGTIRSIAILLRNSLFKRLTVCLMLSGAVSEAIMELLVQYLQLVAGFTPKEQAVVFILWGGAALVIQTVVLRWLLFVCGEKRVLTIGLMSTLVQQVILFFARKPWMGYTAIVMGAFGSVSFPAISSIKSTHATDSEQGAVQGALYGARAMAMGVGPLVFAAVFSLFSRTSSSLPYIPGAPFALGGLLTLVAVAVSISIERDMTTTPMPLLPTDNSDAAEHSSLAQESQCSKGTSPVSVVPSGDQKHTSQACGSTPVQI